MSNKTEITRADIMDMNQYAAVRSQRRKAVTVMKKDRRVSVGPDATFYFENYDTMWHQIHEMLHIEQGGEAQIVDELAAYNPMIPNGRELVATLMFEIDEPVRRAKFLAALGGVEHTVSLTIEGETITAMPEDDIERTNEDGKASSIHFLHFPLSETHAELFKKPGQKVMLGITHETYSHMTILSEAVRSALANDLA